MCHPDKSHRQQLLTWTPFDCAALIMGQGTALQSIGQWPADGGQRGGLSEPLLLADLAFLPIPLAFSLSRPICPGSSSEDTAIPRTHGRGHRQGPFSLSVSELLAFRHFRWLPRENGHRFARLSFLAGFTPQRTQNFQPFNEQNRLRAATTFHRGRLRRSTQGRVS